MDVKLREVQPFSVSGLQVRTRNAAEQQPDTARIGPMWERFFVEDIFDKIAHKQPDSFMYGVYSNYESDASGHFDVTAGVAVTAPSEGFAQIQVEGGDYLVFSAKGVMPDSVIQAWGFIWAYFEDNPLVRRKFATDFEVYTGPESVAVYIGIQDPDAFSRSSN
ncbi:GyrI-like domain-containing protein [Pseudomonas sp. GR 6-02]|jgi:predicted transcriptional regulator YdeE|uniref:GyrI-like domain-containing protein n=1 Tax=Pseudomonas sp. GR 6-02 TaxID=1659194 RepID=UPI0007DDD640|nr:GyrI-like domain-containing protein [Pseudomonas sp. GR 6-02]ANI60319.1 transcriptional regulator [Pseudomonas sp. GR 6-02]